MVLTHSDRYGYPASAHACQSCGLVFLNPRMTASAYGQFYDGIYRPLVSAFCDGTPYNGTSRQGLYQRAIMLLSLHLYLDQAALSSLPLTGALPMPAQAARS